MTNATNNGGAAFPTENAMQTGPSSCRYREPGGEGCFDAHVTLMAEESYRMADAMLKARDGQ